MDLAGRLAAACPGLECSDEPVDRLAYGRDLWPRHHLEVRAGRVVEHSRPGLIAWPTTTEQVARVVRLCREEGVALVPFGAGSGVCGAVLPDGGTLVLDLKRMSSIRNIHTTEPTLDVEAGALGVTLESEMERRGWTIGHFPSSILCSTVGGWLAARGAGQCSGRYGKIEDMVASIEMVDGEGEVHTLRRRRDGIDLTPLIIGSEGTLGVITACSLRLHPRATAHAYAAYSFADLAAGWEAMRRLFQAGLRPAVARLYDPFDSLLAKQGSVKRKHEVPSGHEHPAPGGGHAALGRLLRHPAWLNHAIEGLGGPALGGSTLVLIFEGQGSEPHDDASRAARLAAEAGGRSLGEGPARRWLQHRYSVSYRQSPVFRSGAFSDTFEVAAPWSRLGELYESVHRALDGRVFVMAHLSHAYPDGCSIYFSFAGAAATDDQALAVYDAAWKDALGAALAAGGTLSHHHGIGRSKAPRLGQELGAGVDVVRALMRALDPGAILNPGNLLPREGPAHVAPSGTSGHHLDVVSRLVTVPATTPLGEVAAQLAPAGLSLPVAPGAAVDLAQPVGAWVAAGAPGSSDPWSDPCDHLLAGLRARLPSGHELHIRTCPRRAAGPDLAALFIGARERFGALTEVTLRAHGADEQVRPLPYSADRSPAMNEGEERLLARIERALGADLPHPFAPTSPIPSLTPQGGGSESR